MRTIRIKLITKKKKKKEIAISSTSKKNKKRKVHLKNIMLEKIKSLTKLKNLTFLLLNNEMFKFYHHILVSF